VRIIWRLHTSGAGRVSNLDRSRVDIGLPVVKVPINGLADTTASGVVHPALARGILVGVVLNVLAAFWVHFGLGNALVRGDGSLSILLGRRSNQEKIFHTSG